MFSTSRGPRGLLALLTLSAACHTHIEDATEAPLRPSDRPVVRGRILAGSDPVEHAYVYFYPGGHGQQHTPRSGEYEIELPEAGTFEICAAAPSGRRSRPGEFMLTADWNDVATFDLQLGSCALAGVVREASTARVLKDIRVTARGRDESGTNIAVSDRTDADGAFRIQPLRPGLYSLAAEGRIYSSPVSEAFPLAKDERRVAIELRASPDRGELRVDVAYGTRDDLRGSLMIELRPADDPLRGDPRAGSCQFEALRPATYRVLLLRSPRNLEELESPTRLAELEIEIRAGESTALALAVPEDA